jgi:hypothetical protein
MACPAVGLTAPYLRTGGVQIIARVHGDAYHAAGATA